MKFMKNFTAIILAFVMMLALLPTIVIAQSEPSDWAVESVIESKLLGLATPELLNDFSAPTTRLEFCRAAVNLLRQYGYNVDLATPKMFSDTNDRDIGIAATLGITSGTNAEKNLFSPNIELTREQAATMLKRTLDVISVKVDSNAVTWTDAINISSWAVEAVGVIYSAGVMGGTSTTSLVFSPKTPYTHEQSIVTLVRLWSYINPTKGKYDPTDYDPANLRSSRNEVILLDDVSTIFAPRGINVIASIDEARKQYTFDNINGSIRNLAIGDKFVIYPCESVPDGVAIIVSAINIDGNRAIITSTDVSLEDFVESMDVAQIITMTDDMIIDYGEGVTPVSIQNAPKVSFNMQKSTPVLYANANLHPYVVTAAAGSSELTIRPLAIKIPLIEDRLELTGTIAISPKLKADIRLDKDWFDIPTGLEYLELSLDVKTEKSLKLEVLYENKPVDMAKVYREQGGDWKQKYENLKMTKEKCDKYRAKLFDSKFPITTVPGLAVTATFYLEVSAEGSISVEVEWNQNQTIGVKYQNGEWKSINTGSRSTTITGAAEATFFAGAGIDIGLSYIGIVAVSMGPKVGIEIKASTELMKAEIYNTAPSNEIHDCFLCVDGDIALKIDLNLKAKVLGLKVYDGDILTYKHQLGDFYITFGGNNHGKDFGWGLCPYRTGKRYQAFDTGLTLTWYEAKAYCESLGGYLATITSREEQNIITNLIRDRRNFYWLGGTDVSVEGEWKWITGEVWNYTNWDSGQPDNLSGYDQVPENYLTIRSYNGRWNDLQDIADSIGEATISNGGFICEWD